MDFGLPVPVPSVKKSFTTIKSSLQQQQHQQKVQSTSSLKNEQNKTCENKKSINSSVNEKAEATSNPKKKKEIKKSKSNDETSAVEPAIKDLNSDSQTSLTDEKEADMKKKRSRNKNKRPADAKVEIDTNDIEGRIVESVKNLKFSDSALNVQAEPFNPVNVSAPEKPKHVVESRKKANDSAVKQMRQPVARPKPKIKENSDLRATEINQLRIRFNPTGFSQSHSKADDSVKLQCVLPITDPDFAYDLPSIRLEIVLPAKYPGSKTSPIRPIFTVLNSDLPAAIIARIERNMKWGVNGLEGGILVCRPMLKYLEDNLEKWLVDDVRESAFKFVVASEIKVTEKPKDSSKDEDEVRVLEASKTSAKPSGSNLSAVTNSQSNNVSSTSRISIGDWIAPPPITDQSCVGGTPYALTLHFSLIKGIDLLTSQRLSFLASCDRCKFNFPVEDLRPFIDRIEHCPKCTNQTKFYYKSQLITPGNDFEEGDKPYDSVLGNVRFLRAKPVDLLPSQYQTACSRCYGCESDSDDNETASDSGPDGTCKIEKVRVGEAICFNCFRCHQKTRMQIDRIEWISDPTASAPKTKSNSKSTGASSGPALTVGTPLPKNGACEHYKKSFRWYRFPCCGQAFPCDECHGNEHPVEWANRFICGFCSREQSISIKECPECGKDTSAAGRRKSPFWEGGKGTRNQILMSRKDSKKYKNYSTNSTSAVAKKKKAETDK